MLQQEQKRDIGTPKKRHERSNSHYDRLSMGKEGVELANADKDETQVMRTGDTTTKIEESRENNGAGERVTQVGGAKEVATVVAAFVVATNVASKLSPKFTAPIDVDEEIEQKVVTAIAKSTTKVVENVDEQAGLEDSRDEKTKQKSAGETTTEEEEKRCEADNITGTMEQEETQQTHRQPHDHMNDEEIGGKETEEGEKMDKENQKWEATEPQGQNQRDIGSHSGPYKASTLHIPEEIIAAEVTGWGTGTGPQLES